MGRPTNDFTHFRWVIGFVDPSQSDRRFAEGSLSTAAAHNVWAVGQ